MSRGSSVASVLFLLVLAAVRPPTIHAQTAQDPNGVRVITVRYADGRTIKTPVRDHGWVEWTPVFPRIPGAQTLNEGLPLSALQFEHAIDGRDLVLTIALMYGMPHQKRVPVTSVRLSGDHSVRVDELTSFGVQPVTLAIETVARPQLLIPAILMPSSQLEAAVDVDSAGAPRYRVSITNHAQQGVMALAFQAYRGHQKAASGKPHSIGHTQLIAPGETYSLALTASPNPRSTSPADAWFTIDRIVFTSVTWSDGIVEGSDRPALETQVVDDATARQLDRALSLMHAAQNTEAPDLTELRASIASLTIDDPDAVRAAASDPQRMDRPAADSLTRIGMQIAKDGLLNDFDEFLRDPASRDAAARHAWLASAVAKFDGWRTRIVTAPR